MARQSNIQLKKGKIVAEVICQSGKLTKSTLTKRQGDEMLS
jgi:hypothetical protein